MDVLIKWNTLYIFRRHFRDASFSCLRGRALLLEMGDGAPQPLPVLFLYFAVISIPVERVERLGSGVQRNVTARNFGGAKLCRDERIRTHASQGSGLSLAS